MASSSITLSAGVRQNLLSLQQTGALMSTTQNRLATGKKVNTALDNPTNFFTAASLQSRSGDLSALLDSMSNGIKTLEAADNGLSAITKTVESMQSTLRQARQDKSNVTASYAIDTSISTATVKNLQLSGGAVGTTPISIALNTADVAATAASETGSVAVANDAALQALAGAVTLTDGNGNTVTYTINGTSTKANLTTALGANGYTASFNGSDQLVVSRADGSNFTASGAGSTALGLAATATTNGVAAVAGQVQTVDQLVTAINGNTSLTDKVRASNDNGKLRIENQSTSALTVTGYNSTSSKIDGSAGTATIAGNDVRKNLVAQFNDFRDQLDKLSDDASFNGINLLRGDKLKITFNENGSSSIDIQAKDATGAVRAINASNLGITTAINADFDSDTNIDARLDKLSTALNTLRSQASAFGSNLSIVQNRQDFTKTMITTLQTGADNLVLADTNEEGANMLALQTRQQLSTTALSLANQANQAVLRLF
jgi:flagellin